MEAEATFTVQQVLATAVMLYLCMRHENAPLRACHDGEMRRLALGRFANLRCSPLCHRYCEQDPVRRHGPMEGEEIFSP